MVERCYRKWQLSNSRQASDPQWADLDKKPKRSYPNTRAAIVALGVICSYDEFHDRMLVGGHPIQQWAGELSDGVNIVLRQMIVDKFGFDPGKENIADATSGLCVENRFDPVVDYLNDLDWGGTPRLE